MQQFILAQQQQQQQFLAQQQQQQQLLAQQQQSSQAQMQQQQRLKRTKQVAKKRGKKTQQQPSLLDEDEDLEFVQETQFPQQQEQQQQQQPQPPNLTRTRGGAPSIPKATGGGGNKWTEDEEEALTKAWLHFSENSREGNYQKSETLWGDIIPYFFRLMGKDPYRSYDGIVSKWGVLKKEVTDFIAIVNKGKLNIQSGANTVDFIEKMKATYYTKNGRHFTHMKAWRIAEQHVTWFQQTTTEEMSQASTDSNKRPRSESSIGGFQDFNLNDEFEDDFDNDVQEINKGRPMGRDKARKAKGKGVATSSEDTFSGKWDEHLDFVKEKDARRKEIQLEQKAVLAQYNKTLASQQMLADVEMLMKMPDGTIPEANKDLVSDIHRQIRERYGR